MERSEQQRTVIKSLRVKYNTNLGYFIQVTKANLHLIPADYIRRQTTVNGERYVTEALKQKDREILSANDRLIEREQELLKAIVHAILVKSTPLDELANQMAEIDVLSGWAQLAKHWDYCNPEIIDDCAVVIREGRHPVVEKIIKESEQTLTGMCDFIANATDLSSIET
jgi:DNA mismatch repair protein MutS